jgi:hypothetical protein
MTSKELQIEIQKSLDKVPDVILQDILNFLRQVENQPPEKIELFRNLRMILNEDKELLTRLAQ